MEEIEEHIWLCTTQTVLDDGVSADKKKDSPLLLLLLLRSSLVCVLLVALLLLLSVYCIDVYSLVVSPTFHSQSFGTKVTMHIFFYRMYK
jgi:hypothetical protein